MPAHRKTLNDLVHDRSFLARRHSPLLLEAPPVADPDLANLQELYQAERSELERRALALQFEKALREPRELTHTPTAEDRLEEIVNMPPAELDLEANRRASERFARATLAAN